MYVRLFLFSALDVFTLSNAIYCSNGKKIDPDDTMESRGFLFFLVCMCAMCVYLFYIALVLCIDSSLRIW